MRTVLNSWPQPISLLPLKLTLYKQSYCHWERTGSVNSVRTEDVWIWSLLISCIISKPFYNPSPPNASLPLGFDWVANKTEKDLCIGKNSVEQTVSPHDHYPIFWCSFKVHLNKCYQTFLAPARRMNTIGRESERVMGSNVKYYCREGQRVSTPRGGTVSLQAGARAGAGGQCWPPTWLSSFRCNWVNNHTGTYW